ncbi:thioredoxin family protein [Siminovitchia terrae]|nr:thioredoxin domain-containing protein [Siminovitchia terrae]
MNAYWYSIQWGFKPRLNKVKASGGCHKFLGEIYRAELDKIRAQIRQGAYDNKGDKKMAILHVTSNNEIEPHLNGGKPVLLNFWAKWCGPCRMLIPVLEQLDEELGDKVQILKVDVDEGPDLAAQYGVMGIPHTRIIINNNIKDPLVGYVPYEKLKMIVESEL